MQTFPVAKSPNQAEFYCSDPNPSTQSDCPKASKACDKQQSKANRRVRFEEPINDKFRRIGQGFCGTVWAPEEGDGFAIKREDGGPGRSVLNDYNMHQRIHECRPTMIHVPQCHRYVSSDDQEWWESHLSRFPPPFQEPCNALLTGRIEPFPELIRSKIIDKYYPKSLQQIVSSSEPDQDCLIRPYLGRRRRLVNNSRFQAFSLRNYPLHIDQIEELGLDGTHYARVMAQTLAELYWKLHIDANKIEFVLAPPRTVKSAPFGSETSLPPVAINSSLLGDHALWILDFDCCKDMPMDEASVELAVKAYFKNDPYYPRPGRETDQTLWNEFMSQFIQAGVEIIGLESPYAHLPALWIEMVTTFDEKTAFIMPQLRQFALPDSASQIEQGDACARDLTNAM